MKKVFILQFGLLLIIGTGISAQEECAVTLKKAEKLYDEGVIEEIPGMLQPCLEKGFSRVDRIRALRLVILCHIFEDRKDLAEQTMLTLLNYDPEYEANKAVDPAEFIQLYNSYRTNPVYSIGIMGGLNSAYASPTVSYGMDNTSGFTGEFNPSGMGFHVMLFLNRYLAPNTELSMGLSYVQNKFESIDTLLDFALTSFDETQNRLELPVSVTYDFQVFNLRPYLRGGINASYLLNAYSQATRTYLDNSHRDVTGSDIEINDYRNNFNLALTGGAGLKYKVKRGYFFLDARYNYYFLNSVKRKSRYNNPELLFKYYHVDDDFQLSNLLISAGYMYSFYKPEKIVK